MDLPLLASCNIQPYLMPPQHTPCVRQPATQQSQDASQSPTQGCQPVKDMQPAARSRLFPADLSSKQGQDAAACPHVHDSLILEINEVPHDGSIVGTCRAQILFCLAPARKLCFRWRDEISSITAEQTSADHVLEHILPA